MAAGKSCGNRSRSRWKVFMIRPEGRAGWSERKINSWYQRVAELIPVGPGTGKSTCSCRLFVGNDALEQFVQFFEFEGLGNEMPSSQQVVLGHLLLC